MGMAPSRREWGEFWGRWGWEWLLPGGNGRDSGIAGDGNGSFPAGMGGILGSLGMGMAPSWREWGEFWDHWRWERLLPGGNGRDSGITGAGNTGKRSWESLGMAPWEWLLPGGNGGNFGVAGDGNGSFPVGMGGILGSLGMGMAPSRREWEGFWDRWGWEWLLPGGNGRDSGIAGDGNGSFPAGMGGILGSLGMGMAPSWREWEGFWDHWRWERLLPGGNGRDSGITGAGNAGKRSWESLGMARWERLLPGRNGRDFGVAGDGNGSFPVGMGGILGSLGMGMAPSRREWEGFWDRWGWEWLLPSGNGRDSGIAGDGNGSFPAGMGGILGSLGMGMAPSWREWGEFWGRWEWEWLLPGGNGRDSGITGAGNAGKRSWESLGMAPWEWLLPGWNGGNFGVTGAGNGSFLA
ncbi:uncharacterized protein LOC116436420 isoform X5 [Corvus moneduloides]|uniref:uncharacterized protein LOC116436420 isoform X5 n=1 Tax=Corvus moneduloides TaxID=1196302 RepID=UPI001361FB6C|nr:uncharacterized protein LOC116436420 isoform X5 [Corvus moneduloides]